MFLRRNISTRLPKYSEELYLDRLLSNSKNPFVDSKFKPGDHVNIYNPSTKSYDKQGTVENITAPRSVLIDSNGERVRRIQRFLTKSHGDLPLEPNQKDLDEGVHNLENQLPFGGRGDIGIITSNSPVKEMVTPRTPQQPAISEHSGSAKVTQKPTRVIQLEPGETTTLKGRVVRKPLGYRLKLEGELL